MCFPAASPIPMHRKERRREGEQARSASAIYFPFPFQLSSDTPGETLFRKPPATAKAKAGRPYIVACNCGLVFMSAGKQGLFPAESKSEDSEIFRFD